VKRTFTGLLTKSDYIDAVRAFHLVGLSPPELAKYSIREILNLPDSVFSIKHNNFWAVDAEDDVYSLYVLMCRLDSDFVPVVDPKAKNLVSVLGYFDLLYLLAYCAQQYNAVACIRVKDIVASKYEPEKLFVPRHASFPEVLTALTNSKIGNIAVVDENETVLGLYHKSDVDFLTKAEDADLILANYVDMKISDAIASSARNNLLPTSPSEAAGGAPESSAASFESIANEINAPGRTTGFCSCSEDSNLKDVLDMLVNHRQTCVVCLTPQGRYIAILEIKDFLRFFLGTPTF